MPLPEFHQVADQPMGRDVPGPDLDAEDISRYSPDYRPISTITVRRAAHLRNPPVPDPASAGKGTLNMRGIGDPAWRSPAWRSSIRSSTCCPSTARPERLPGPGPTAGLPPSDADRVLVTSPTCARFIPESPVVTSRMRLTQTLSTP
ncbi:hypothetical protein GCM10023259_005980 [Thermocatellispora tengchongensis]